MMKKSREKYPKPYYPFSNELCLFMDKNPDFYDSLKLANPTRFEFIPLIFTSYPTKDEVIGMWYCDKENLKKGGRPIFKQDFIVNSEFKNVEFHSYVNLTTYKLFEKSKFVHLIDDFFTKYGKKEKFYHKENKTYWEHHYAKEEDLPDEPNLKILATVIKIKNAPIV